jgi:hypothetical protein
MPVVSDGPPLVGVLLAAVVFSVAFLGIAHWSNLGLVDLVRSLGVAHKR